MADAVISIVVEQLASFVQQEVKLVLSVRKDVKDLTSTLKMVQAVLHDAETRQIKEAPVKLWLESLKSIVYDAEDVLDEWSTRNQISLIQGVENGGVGIHKKVLSYFMCPCFSIGSVAVRYDIGGRIKEIRESLDAVNRGKEQFKLKEISPSHEVTRDRQTTSSVNVLNTFGREQAKNTLVSWLEGGSSSQVKNTNVISIVGTGGFGKTTLANLVLEEVLVKKIFEKKIFVCVSEPFDLLKVARSIIEQVTEKTPPVKEREPLLKCLSDSLKGKRFLTVLDDVWTENPNEWTPLKDSFDGGAQGSWVIVTTRNAKVAEMMCSKHTYNLAELLDDDSWLFFKQLVFEGKSEEFVLKFEEIGEKIVAKCKGVPLVIKTIGTLMRSMKKIKEWNDVLTSEIWEIEEIAKQFSPSFFLSYNPLPSNLKQCFMYCAVFPKDTQMYKNKLVKLWMAQGFLGSGGGSNLEENGCKYFDDLAMLSFFQDFEKSPDGDITSCKMHDLIHDFALFLTKGECSFLEDDRQLDGSNVRHLVTASLRSSSDHMTEKLRTLLITKSVNPGQLIKIFNQLKCIRTLDLSDCKIEELPSEVKRLLHLRYLDLSDTELVELPETICDLFNLQTLMLNRCTQLIKLPGGIGKLLNLRHLELEGTGSLSCLPQGIGRLRFLRSLCKFIVGDASLGCNIRELKDLCYLQGSLKIIGLKQVADASEAAQAELKKKSIVVLSLKFESLEGEEDSENTEEEESEILEEGKSEYMTNVLENLQPHENVEELNISSFKGSKFPSWIPNRSMSANLLRLALTKCHYTSELPALGSLASLEELTLKGMKSMKHIGNEFYGLGVAFQKLKKLVIDDMEELVQLELPMVITDGAIMPCLQELVLLKCPMLRALPPGLGKLKSLQHLEIKQLSQVKHIGQEFYGFDDDNDNSNPGGVMVVAFPQLKVLKIKYLAELVEWELPNARDNKKIMPCLIELELSDCPMLSALPGLGTLESLESLYISKLPLIKQVGLEFWGISVAADEFGGCSTEERVINVGGDGDGEREGEKRIISNLRTTFRNLCSSFFSRIKYLGLEFLGIPQERKGSEERRAGRGVLLFPKLTKLEFENMEEWEVWILPPFQEDIQIMPRLTNLKFWGCQKLRALPDLTRFKSLEILNISWMEGLVEFEREEGVSFPPWLRELTLLRCTSLRVIPGYLFPHTLRKLSIWNCPQLRGVQPCLPPLLESLELRGDVGVFSESLPIAEEEENNNYPNLKDVIIEDSEHPSLPKGFNHLKAIQDLQFYWCESLDFDLNELKHLTILQTLWIFKCPILAKRFQSSGDDWMTILSHVPKIRIDFKGIKGSD